MVTDKNGITRYLVTVFVLGYAVQIGALASGILSFEEGGFFYWVILAIIMFIPAIAAVVALLNTPEHEQDTIIPIPQIWPIPFKPAAQITLLIPAVFAVIYTIGTVFGYQKADFNMHEVAAMLRAMSPQPLPDESVSTVGYLMLTIGFPLSILLGASLFALIALGQEYGWRGYLLPRLMPLGRIPASLLVALLSYLWALPLLYAAFGGAASGKYLWYSLFLLLLFFLLAGVFLAEILRRSQNLGLCAICSGAIIAQDISGIWDYIFPMNYFPHTGPYGTFGILCWTALTVSTLLLPRRP